MPFPLDEDLGPPNRTPLMILGALGTAIVIGLLAAAAYYSDARENEGLGKFMQGCVLEQRFDGDCEDRWKWRNPK